VVKSGDGQIGIVPALVRSTFLVHAVYAESGREHGLTPQQGQLLCVLMAQPYGMSELGDMLRLAKSSLTGLVDRSERNGLVKREPDPHDQRAVRVALTSQGGRLAEEFYAETCRRIETLAAGLSGPERDRLAGLLGRIVLDNEVPVLFLEPDDQGAHPVPKG
jgi:DNA-binding MarR family transcriptional regulator